MDEIKHTTDERDGTPILNFFEKAGKWLDIKRLQAWEKYVRVKPLRLLAVQGLGTYVAYCGVNHYSHRVALILLGAGIILAAERQ